MVYLPNDVDGLALPDPSSYKSQKIIAREKTPYISQSKYDQDHPEELERMIILASSVRNPTFTSAKKQVFNSDEHQADRHQSETGGGCVDEYLQPASRSQTEMKLQQNSINQAESFNQNSFRAGSRGAWDRSLTDFKPNELQSRSRELHALVPQSQTLFAGEEGAESSPEGQLDGSGYMKVNCSGISIKEADERMITFKQPETIVEHVRSVRDPDPDKKDKMFRQLFMDDSFKEQYGTKLAVTPNKLFGNQDSAEVKKGTGWMT